MARLTVRLPDSLYEALTRRAQEEGVSRNQFIVYALTQFTTLQGVTAQREAYRTLLERLDRHGDAEAGRRAAQAFLQAHATGGDYLSGGADPAAQQPQQPSP